MICRRFFVRGKSRASHWAWNSDFSSITCFKDSSSALKNFMAILIKYWILHLCFVYLIFKPCIGFEGLWQSHDHQFFPTAHHLVFANRLFQLFFHRFATEDLKKLNLKQVWFVFKHLNKFIMNFYSKNLTFDKVSIISDRLLTEIHVLLNFDAFFSFLNYFLLSFY